MNMNKKIRTNYLKPGHRTAFGGISTLTRFYKIQPAKAKDILSSISSYTLHREYKKPRRRNPYYVYEKREQVQVDLIDVKGVSKHNDGMTFLLCVIDVFSRKLWCRPITSKHAKTVLNAFKEILHDMGGYIKNILCDRGTELKNQEMRNFLSSSNINLMHPSSDVKAGIVERVNRSLQNLIYQYLTENEKYRYIDRLQDLVSTYNNRPHGTLKGMSPNSADDDRNKERVLDALNMHYSKHLKNKNRNQKKFKIGDIVRIKTAATKFTRGYNEQFSRETFKVVDINDRMPIKMYILESTDDGEKVDGGFYPSEMQLVNIDVFKIERILRRRTHKGVREVLVKWQDYSEQHNSWVREDSLEPTDKQ